MLAALIQLAYGDDEPVAARVERAAALVRAQAGADLVVLPELWAPGGFSYREWPTRAERLDGQVASAMSAAAKEAGVVLHAGSIIERADVGEHGLANTSMMFGPGGELLATYRKIHRFGFGAGEPHLLDAGELLVTLDIPRSTSAPSGTDTVCAGLATCYDLRFPELFRLLGDEEAHIVLVPAAWPAARVEHWSLLGRARAIENQVFMLQCNTAGTHAGVAMGGLSQVVDPGGAVLAQAGEGEQVLTVDIDLAAVARTREAFPVLADRRLLTAM